MRNGRVCGHGLNGLIVPGRGGVVTWADPKVGMLREHYGPMYAGSKTVVAGLVVSLLSGSELSVSGPAAGLTVIVAAAIQDLGTFEVFAMAVVLAGLIQIGLGRSARG